MNYNYDRRRAAAHQTLDNATRTKINDALSHKGFDGNGRFRSTGQALNVAQGVLEKFGVEVAEVLSAWGFKGPKGYKNIDLAFSNAEDPFSPVDISNSVLAFSWTELADERIEVVAYLS